MAGVWLLAFGISARADRPIRMAESPALSPDGKTLAFAYEGEIWTVPMEGGVGHAADAAPGQGPAAGFFA